MSGYAASGTYTSPVFDAGADVLWQTASWLADAPAGTTVVLEVRTGLADGTWTPFRALTTPGELIDVNAPAGRYAQYRVTLSTAAPALTPALKEVTLTFVK
jgi:hypothetical protein